MARIAIIHPEGNFNNNPNLLGIINILSENGHLIDIYASKQVMDQSPPNPSVNTILLTPQHTFMHDAAVLLPSIAHIPPFESAKAIAPQMPRPDLIIGIDRGIIEAHALADFLKVPYGLISYEIYFAEETGKNFKLPEITACSSLSFAICQDTVRANELCKENEIAPNKIINIPVAAAGTRPRNKSFAIHKALGISEDKKLMLYMGEISCAWAGIFDILEHTKDWPDNWNLILHHRYGKANASDIAGIVGDSKRKNIFFSPFQTLPGSQMSELLNSVDAGLAFYCPNNGHVLSGNNLKYIGLASGKISTYLQHGVPVVTNQLGEISGLITSYEAGLAVDNGSMLAKALHSYSSDQSINLQQNCHKLFSEVLDLNKKIIPLLKRIEEITATKSAQTTKLNRNAEIIPAKKWLEVNPSGGRVIQTRTAERRSMSLWSFSNLTVWSELGIIITPNGSILEESTTEYNTKEALQQTTNSNIEGDIVEWSGEYMSLSGYWCEGFYHWMLEWLPRAYFAEISGFKGKYVLSKVNKFIVDSLSMLGIASDRIISAPPGYWKPESLWLIETCHAGEYEHFPDILKGVRQRLLGSIGVNPQAKARRIYISRTNPNRPRRIVNEPELMELLIKFGFEWVDLDNMPLKLQLELVSNAEALIGPHGAGIVHSLFIKEKSLVIEIFSPNYINPCCVAVQDALNHRYHPLVSLNYSNNYPHGDNIHAPLRLVELTLNHELK